MCAGKASGEGAGGGGEWRVGGSEWAYTRFTRAKP